MPLTTISVWLGVSMVMPSGNRIIDQMREAERQGQALGLHRGAIADADQLELLLVALGHARDHVRQVRARRARDGVRAFGARARLDREVLVLLHDLDAALRAPASASPWRP